MPARCQTDRVRIDLHTHSSVSDGTDRVHVSFDLDCLDPADAPGVGTGDPISPDGTGYGFDGFVRNTGLAIDPSGNIGPAGRYRATVEVGAAVRPEQQ